MAFEDGATLEARTVIWATGFRLDYSWIELPISTPQGRLEHRHGVTVSLGSISSA